MGARARPGRAALAFALLVVLGACGRPSFAGASPNPSPSAAPSPVPSPSARPMPSPSPEPSPSAKRSIRISLSAQHLWAYDGNRVVVSTVITTGMPALPTPTGTFHVQAKYSPYRFVSPWARGSPFYYDPLWVDYAILFADGGYFIHDAWWQSNFGPGGNFKTGSHGCVNVPPAAMPALYAWAVIGELVVIVN